MYLYVSFIALQLALFNLILLGIIIIYMGKLYDMMTRYAFKFEYNYRNSAFQKHIQEANKQYFSNKNVELVGLQEGLLLELQLPENVDDQFMTNPTLENRGTTSAFADANFGQRLPNDDINGAKLLNRAITERP